MPTLGEVVAKALTHVRLMIETAQARTLAFVEKNADEIIQVGIVFWLVTEGINILFTTLLWIAMLSWGVYLLVQWIM